MESIKSIIPAVLQDFQNPKNSLKQKLWSEWPNIIGSSWAEKTRPSLAENGTLFIWVNESALGFELNQKYRQTILKAS